jgi:hypothetical protein
MRQKGCRPAACPPALTTPASHNDVIGSKHRETSERQAAAGAGLLHFWADLPHKLAS